MDMIAVKKQQEGKLTFVPFWGCLKILLENEEDENGFGGIPNPVARHHPKQKDPGSPRLGGLWSDTAGPSLARSDDGSLVIFAASYWKPLCSMSSGKRSRNHRTRGENPRIQFRMSSPLSYKGLLVFLKIQKRIPNRTLEGPDDSSAART